MSTILVTGAAGFIGSWIAEELHKRGHEVICVDDLSAKLTYNLKYLPNLYNVDLRNESATDILVKCTKPEVVYHLAAHPHEGLSQFCPTSIFTTTCNSSMSVFKAALKYDVKRVVYFSSMARYGDGMGGKFLPPFNEDDPRAPVDVYGSAKCAAEVSLEALNRAHGLEYVTLVPHNVYGERQNIADPYRNVIGIWINSLLRKKPIYIYGDGKQVRSFSYIMDSLECYVRAGTDKNISGEVINIGSGVPISLNKLAEIVLTEFNTEISPVYVPDRPCEVKEAFCTIEKSKRMLGYEDKTSIEEGVHKMSEWAKELGPKEPNYLTTLEIEKNVPITWRDHLI